MTKKEAEDIAKIYVASIVLLGNAFNAENINEVDNQKVQKAIESICMKLLKQTKAGCTATSDFEAVNMVLNH